MAKLDALFEVQLGLEATNAWGTEVASTVKLMGVEELTITPVITAERENELRGTLQPGYRSHIRAAHGEATMSGLLEIDDFPYLLRGFGGPAAGATDAAGNFTHTWTSPTEDSDSEDAQSFTLMYTDRADTYSLLGATLNSLTIEGESGGPIMYEAGFIGKVVSTDVNAALSDRVTKPAMGHMGQLYIDPGSDAVGGTEIANQAYSFSWNVEANRKFLTHVGNLNPSGFREGKWDGSLSISIEASTDTYPYIDAILSSTNTMPEKNVRLKFSAATDSIATLDFAGVLLSAPELYSDEDGVITFDFELVGQSNSGLATFAGAEVYSTVSTIA
jgi:hypothetical protein